MSKLSLVRKLMCKLGIHSAVTFCKGTDGQWHHIVGFYCTCCGKDLYSEKPNRHISNDPFHWRHED